MINENSSTILQTALIGTNDYHATMRQITQASLQRLACYVPSVNITPVTLPPVPEPYPERADPVMQSLAEDTSLRKCNPRSQHLTIAWVLSNHQTAHIFNEATQQYRTLHKRIAILHILIALGYMPDDKDIQNAKQVAYGATFQAHNYKSSVAAAISYGAITIITADTAQRAKGFAYNMPLLFGDVILREAIQKQAKQWAHISDDVVMLIARNMMLDILYSAHQGDSGS